MAHVTFETRRRTTSAARHPQFLVWQELVLMALAGIAMWLLDLDPLACALLIATLGLVLVAELLNTGIEAVVDRVGPEWHPLSRKAKDAGSAAVTVSLAVHAGVWLCVL